MVRRRHGFAHPKTIPGSLQAKCDMFRKLTGEINCIESHFEDNPQNWRDARARGALERKIQQRAQVLAEVWAKDPQLAEQLEKEV